MWWTFYPILKFWGPIVTVIGLMIKGYEHASNKFYRWADELLSKNAKIIADRVDEASRCVLEMISYHKEMVSKQETIEKDVALMKDSFADHKQEVTRNYSSVIVGIEGVKTTQDVIIDKLEELSNKL